MIYVQLTYWWIVNWYKWNMHKQESESVIENEMHKILRDLEIQKDHPVQARRLDQVLINKVKRMCYPVDFAVSADHRVRNKRKQKTWQISRPRYGLKKIVAHEGDSGTNHSWSLWKYLQESLKETGWIIDQRND